MISERIRIADAITRETGERVPQYAYRVTYNNGVRACTVYGATRVESISKAIRVAYNAQ